MCVYCVALAFLSFSGRKQASPKPGQTVCSRRAFKFMLLGQNLHFRLAGRLQCHGQVGASMNKIGRRSIGKHVCYCCATWVWVIDNDSTICGTIMTNSNPRS